MNFISALCSLDDNMWYGLISVILDAWFFLKFGGLASPFVEAGGVWKAWFLGVQTASSMEAHFWSGSCVLLAAF